jgi:ornithine cyclodeaminase/alanine dehydrogenase-like protein (mu-crystallin family)
VSAATGPRWITAAELASALSIDAAIEALVSAFKSGGVELVDRTVVSHAGNDMLVMPACGDEGFGVKLVTIAPANPGKNLPLIQGIYVLFGATNHEPRFIMDGAELTRIRTAAVSTLGASHLARADSEVLVIFGSGVQARGHAVGICGIRPVKSVVIVNEPNPESADRLVAELVRDGYPASTGRAQDVADADIVCTCTNASRPLFAGEWLRAGTHVAAIGNYLADGREVDADVVRRSRVFIEDIDGLRSEIPGDLGIPAQDSEWALSDIVGDLKALVRGEVEGRTGSADLTMLKTVGIAYEDLIVAAAAAKALDQ